MIACFAARVVEIAQRRACTHLTSIIIIGARVVRRPRIRCRAAGLSRVMCARRALVPQKSRIDFDSFSTYLKVSRHAGRVR